MHVRHKLLIFRFFRIILLFSLFLRNWSKFVFKAVWALGNIGGDGSDCRDMLLELDVMSTLLQMMLQPQKKWRRGKDIRPNLCEQKTVTLSMKRTIIWTISNLCRGKPQPAFSVVTVFLENF